MPNNSNYRKYSSEKIILLETRKQIENFVYWSEEFIFGKGGIDAITGFIPIFGQVYTSLGSFWLIVQGYKIQANSKDIFFIIWVTVLDVVIGIIPIPLFSGLVDATLRVHAWGGKRLINHIDKRLANIN